MMLHQPHELPRPDQGQFRTLDGALYIRLDRSQPLPFAGDVRRLGGRILFGRGTELLKLCRDS